jgi:hypothetical protein
MIIYKYRFLIYKHITNFRRNLEIFNKLYCYKNCIINLQVLEILYINI